MEQSPRCLETAKSPEKRCTSVPGKTDTIIKTKGQKIDIALILLHFVGV